MEASAWPGSPRPNPYLPRSLQIEQGMPGADHRVLRRRASLRMQRWRCGADRLRCSYVALEEDIPVAPSPLLSTLPEAPVQPAQATAAHWARGSAGLRLTEQSLSPAPLQGEERAARGVATRALEQQAACPFQAFAAQRLGANPALPPWRGLSAAERGVLVHGALFRLFGRLPGRAALLRADTRQRLACIDEALGQAVRDIPAPRRELLGTAVLRMEEQRQRELLSSWLELEAQRGEEFRVLEREVPAQLQLGAVTLKLRLDRVDGFADGARLVLDYKTGAGDSPRQWFASPLRSPQLPVYALLEPAADGVSFAHLRSDGSGFRGIGARAFADGISDDLASAAGNPQIGSMDAARHFWREELESLAEAFAAGSAAVEPQSGACRYCAREALCRVSGARR